MLELLIENTSIPLADGTSITVTATNSALSKDNVGRVYSYPFKLPWSPQLLQVFNHIRRLDSKTKSQNLAAVIKIAGFELPRGVIKTNDENAKSSQSTFNLYFKKDNNAVLRKLEDFKIAEACPKIVIPQTKFAGYVLKLKTNVIPGTQYYIEINGTRYNYTPVSSQEIEVMQHISDAINAQYPDVSSIRNNQQSGHLELILTLSSSFSPIMDSTSAIELGGFQYVSFSNYAQAIHDNFIEFFHQNLTSPRTDISFNWIVNEDFYQGKNPKYFFPWFNYAFHYDNDPDWTIPTNSPSKIEEFERSFIPFYKLQYVLTQILTRIGIVDFEYQGNQNFWQSLMTLVIDNNYALDNVRKDYFFLPDEFDGQNTVHYAQGTERYLNCHVSEILPANHLPDWTAKAFLDGFADSFNLDYEVTDTNKLVFKSKNRIFNQEIIVWDYLLEGYERGFKDDNGFILRYAKNETELFSDGTLIEMQNGAGEIIKELPFSTLHVDTSFNIVKTKRAGSTTAFNLGQKNFHFRLFFDKGISQNRYWASDNTTDYISLIITDPIGIYQSCYKGSIDLDAAGYPLSIERVIPPQELSQLMTFQNAKIYLKTDKGSVIAFIKEIQTKIDVNTPKLLKVKFEMIVS